jgi:hypothetical protein
MRRSSRFRLASFRALIVSLLYKPDAQASESSHVVAHPSLALRACMSSLLAFRKVMIKTQVDQSAYAPGSACWAGA